MTSSLGKFSIFLAALISVSWPCRAAEIRSFCYSYGDYTALFEFHAYGSVDVTIYDGYLITSEEFPGSYFISGEKITIAWDHGSETYDYDKQQRQVLPPDDSDFCDPEHF